MLGVCCVCRGLHMVQLSLFECGFLYAKFSKHMIELSLLVEILYNMLII